MHYGIAFSVKDAALKIGQNEVSYKTALFRVIDYFCIS